MSIVVAVLHRLNCAETLAWIGLINQLIVGCLRLKIGVVDACKRDPGIVWEHVLFVHGERCVSALRKRNLAHRTEIVTCRDIRQSAVGLLFVNGSAGHAGIDIQCVPWSDRGTDAAIQVWLEHSVHRNLDIRGGFRAKLQLIDRIIEERFELLLNERVEGFRTCIALLRERRRRNMDSVSQRVCQRAEARAPPLTHADRICIEPDGLHSCKRL